VVLISCLKLKSPSGDMFPFSFLKVMMAEEKKIEEGFTKIQRKKIWFT
jgi:hypothetical protein